MPAGETRSASIGGWRSIGRPDVMLAAALTIVLLPSSLLALVQEPNSVATPLVVILALLFVALHALSFLALRFPVASFVAASVAMLALAAMPGSDGVPAAVYPSSAAFLLCLAQVVIQRSRLLGLGALGIGVLGAVIITFMPMSVLDPQVRWGMLVGLIALVSVAWAIGMLQQLRRQQADDRDRARVQAAITQERMRINRDLHDVVAHSMTVMIAQAEVARAYVREDPDESARAMSVVVDTGREALRGMRGIVAAGSDAPREPVPDLDVIRADVDAARSAETETTFVEHGRRGQLDPPARIALHHAVREALANAIRHTAPPRRIDVRMRWTAEALVVTVVDDGGSGVASERSPGAGMGLIGMAERVRSAGGMLSAQAADRSGWTVRVQLPRMDAEIGMDATP
ncbi:sensor histidine kinase [Microbacterium sp.]|uniref:sensor histidine kinase n=1 Tax=Microbacterium sp. TaxID=51671 RepID=UPI002BAE1EAF|nr:histidine kinase [Microbacterium sp.]HWK76909.1 histidine kinase [Microbacterium sp.]